MPPPQDTARDDTRVDDLEVLIGVGSVGVFRRKRVWVKSVMVSVPERSKGVDSSSTVFALVGSNPTADTPSFFGYCVLFFCFWRYSTSRATTSSKTQTGIVQIVLWFGRVGVGVRGK